jgi:hypothetical protein
VRAGSSTNTMEGRIVSRAVALAVRRALWQASQQGLTPSELADRFHLPPRTVRHLLCLARNHAGQMPPPAYHTGPRQRPADQVAFHTALALKQEHPDWGARFLGGVLADAHPDLDLPSERTLRRWLRGLGQPKAPAGRRRERPGRAQAPHQRWQVDACDQMRLATATQVSWLRNADECTGANLGTVVFPPRAVQPGARPHGSGDLAGVVRVVGPP